MQNSEYYYSKIVIKPATSSQNSRYLDQKQNTNSTPEQLKREKTSSPYEKGAFDNTAPFAPTHRLHLRWVRRLSGKIDPDTILRNNS